MLHVIGGDELGLRQLELGQQLRNVLFIPSRFDLAFFPLRAQTRAGI